MSFYPDKEFQARLTEISKRVQKGLSEVKGWPLRTPGKTVLHHCSSMVAAAQDALEKTGECAHHCVILGDSKVRLNVMVLHPDFDGDREKIQQHKWATWSIIARLFNLLDGDVMLWLMDAWISDISPEQLETGEWEWPKDDPQRREALNLCILTPTQTAGLMGKYDRPLPDVRGPIKWSPFERANNDKDMAFMQAMAPMVAETKHLRPVVMEGEHRGIRASFMSRLEPPGPLLDLLSKLGHYVANVDERYLHLN